MLDTNYTCVFHSHQSRTLPPKWSEGSSRSGVSVAVKLLCCVCRRKPVEANGRCRACRLYRWRQGHDRPPELVVKEIEREARKVARILDMQMA